MIVLWANRLNDWNTMPTSARRRARSRPSSGSGTPSIRMRPLSMVSSRLMQRQSVDLPEPEGPMMTTTSPRATSRSMSNSTCRLPNRLFTFSTSTSGSVAAITGTVAAPDLRRTVYRSGGPGPRFCTQFGAASRGSVGDERLEEVADGGRLLHGLAHRRDRVGRQHHGLALEPAIQPVLTEAQRVALEV